MPVGDDDGSGVAGVVAGGESDADGVAVGSGATGSAAGRVKAETSAELPPSPDNRDSPASEDESRGTVESGAGDNGRKERESTERQDGESRVPDDESEAAASEVAAQVPSTVETTSARTNNATPCQTGGRTIGHSRPGE